MGIIFPQIIPQFFYVQCQKDTKCSSDLTTLSKYSTEARLEYKPNLNDTTYTKVSQIKMST